MSKIPNDLNQGSGYPMVAVLIEPPVAYYQQGEYDPNTNNTCDEVILDELLERYSDAWEKLAEM